MKNRVKLVLKWIMISILIGLIGGLVGTAFHISVDAVTEIRQENNWIVYLLPIGGLLIAFLYKKFNAEKGMDTNRVLRAVKSEADVPVRMMPLIFSGTVISHLFGGSVGREGAALQLGGSVGYNLSRYLKTDKSQYHLAVMAGMSAVFSALFGTPVAASIFSYEVARVRLKKYYELIPCLIAALVARQTAGIFGVAPIRFDVQFPSINTFLILKLILLSALCGMVAYLFCLSIHKTERFVGKILPNIYFRALFGGALIAVLTYLVGSYDYNGAGMNIIEDAINGKAIWYAFIFKIIFTVISVSCGYRGGEIVPAFFIGSTLGCVVAQLIGLPASFGACIGFIGLFCGAVNCPVASIIIALEIFGGKGILFFVVACVISYITSGNISLYKNQGKYSI
ncbi:MAG: chloride channel protein [Clostridia bacterium]|nr:chloride channel protein [Clostridia bacterium]